MNEELAKAYEELRNELLEAENTNRDDEGVDWHSLFDRCLKIRNSAKDEQ